MTRKSKPRAGRMFFKLALLSGAAMMASACSYGLMGPDGGGIAEWERLAIANEKPAGDAYAAGKKQYKKGLYGLALKNFRAALGHKPKSVETLNAVAATYDKLGRFDLSRRYYARALALDPESPQTLNNIGYSFVMQNDFTTARAYFERARKAGGSASMQNAVGANLAALDAAQGREMAPGQLAGMPVHASAVTSLNASIATPVTLHRNVPVVKNGDRIRVIATAADTRKVAAGDTWEVAAAAVAPAKIRNRRLPQQPVLTHGEAPLSAPVARVEMEPVALSGPVAKTPEPAVKPKLLMANVAEPVLQGEPVAKMSRPATRSEPVASKSEPVIEISNGAGRRFLAARTRDYLTTQGVNAVRLTNADTFLYPKTAIFYREGYRDRAHEIAQMFAMPIAMSRVDEQYPDIRVRLGWDSMEFDDRMLALRSAGS